MHFGAVSRVNLDLDEVAFTRASHVPATYGLSRIGTGWVLRKATFFVENEWVIRTVRSLVVPSPTSMPPNAPLLRIAVFVCRNANAMDKQTTNTTPPLPPTPKNKNKHHHNTTTNNATKQRNPDRLKKGLDNRVSAQFATMQMAGVDAGESKIFATLGAATNLLVDLEAVETEVRLRCGCGRGCGCGAVRCDAVRCGGGVGGWG